VSATARVMRPRFTLTRRQILVIGWSVPLALVAAYMTTNAFATTGQRDLRARWESAVAHGRSDPAALASRTWRAGEPVARIAIPAIGLDLVVVEGGGAERRAPVHLPSSVIPGASGLSVVTGGRFGYGNFFLGLERLRAGDEIVVSNLAGITRLFVSSVEILPARRALDRDSSVAALDLVTPSRAWRSGERLVVHAEAGSRENPR
jgi:sortase (surface protein transpeptidase)